MSGHYDWHKKQLERYSQYLSVLKSFISTSAIMLHIIFWNTLSSVNYGQLWVHSISESTNMNSSSKLELQTNTLTSFIPISYETFVMVRTAKCTGPKCERILLHQFTAVGLTRNNVPYTNSGTSLCALKSRLRTFSNIMQ